MNNPYAYADACESATTLQGLDPIVEALRDAGIPHTVDQTGGFTMCVNVPIVEGGAHYLYVTSGEFMIGEEPDTAVIGEYWDCPLYGVAEREYHQEGWAEYTREDYTAVPIADLGSIVRNIVRNPHPCPDHAPTRDTMET